MAHAAAGKWLFAQKCEFRFGIVQLEALPQSTGVEIAFAGRSNVGKSSLLNALSGRKNLARTSNTPGRTQELNFFLPAAERQNGEIAWLVDMPGYGYARESKQKIARWNQLINDYISGRAQLRRLFILIDSRHGVKENDAHMMDMLDKAAVPYQIILTKCDKISADLREKCEKACHDFLRKRPAAHPHIITSSAQKHIGIDIIRTQIAGLIDMDALGYK